MTPMDVPIVADVQGRRDGHLPPPAHPFGGPARPEANPEVGPETMRGQTPPLQGAGLVVIQEQGRGVVSRLHRRARA